MEIKKKAVILESDFLQIFDLVKKISYSGSIRRRAKALWRDATP